MKVGIIGSGISGLTAAHYLSRSSKVSSIKIFEKSQHIGGWFQSHNFNSAVFETGPHSIRPRGEAGLAVLNLLRSLDLLDTVITSNDQSAIRYIYHSGQKHSLPSKLSSLPQLLTKKTLRPLISAILFEPFRVRKSQFDDESIYSFFERHFGKYFAEVFGDSMVAGIYAGDSRQLSVASCFPAFAEMEKIHPSLILSNLLSMKNTKQKVIFPEDILQLSKATAISFPDGIKTLTKTIIDNMPPDKVDLVTNSPIYEAQPQDSKISLSTKSSSNSFDKVYSCIDVPALADLFPTVDSLQTLSSKLKFSSVAVINLLFSEDSPVKKTLPPGFGHLVPSLSRKDNVLGVLYDSNVFPGQFPRNSAALTVMIGGPDHEKLMEETDEYFIDISLKAIKKQVLESKVEINPEATLVTRNINAIPQYFVGYEKQKNKVVEEMNQKYPQVVLLGNNFDGVGIASCIEKATLKSYL
eukprot:snap_masked-scaffold_25-processed-gene-5.34-mRNA-1 protein AED:1.00 eAED:1.00 QI:0/-1/0/0/-1/1/1/0/466